MIDPKQIPSSDERRTEKLTSFSRLLDILAILRKECPWDRKQTNLSLRPNTIEEVYELSDALLREDDEEIKKELGDVLLHVLFYALIGEENGVFDLEDVCDKLSDKLIYRHPHIFGDTKVKDAKEVEENWEQLKLKEKGGNKTVLSGVPQALPALIKSYRVQEKAANVGFDWEKPSDVWDKVYEELGELRAELEKPESESKLEREIELGDFLFSVVNAARKYGIDPDTALGKSTNKFVRRFNHIESRAQERGQELSEMTLGEMEELYQEAKKLGL